MKNQLLRVAFFCHVMAFRDSVVSIGSVSPKSCSISASRLRHAYSQRDINYTGLHSQQHIPLSTISAEELLGSDIEFSGFLYKRSSERKTDKITSAIPKSLKLPFIPKWQLRYVILYKDWLYYFASEKSKRPKGAFCLKGYHRVMRAEEAATTDQRYAFKIMGPNHNMRTYFFGAASEREMTLWMAHIRVTMEKALHGSAKNRSLQLLDDIKRKNERVFSRVNELDERGIVRSDSVSSGSSYQDEIYEDIEKPLPLYDDTESCVDFHPADIGDRPLPQPPAEWQSHDSGTPRKPDFSRGRSDTITPYVNSSLNSEEPLKRFRSKRGMVFFSPRLKRHIPPAPQIPLRNSSSSSHRVPPFGFRLPSLDSDDNDDEEDDNVPDYLLPSSSPHPPHRGNSAQVTSRVVPQRPEPPRRKSADDENSISVHGLRRRPDGNSFRVKHEETQPLTKKPLPPPKKPQILPKPVINKVSYNKVGAIKDLLPDSAIFESSDKVKAEEMLKKPKVEGMYLVRNSAQAGQKVLMVYHGNEKCKHYKVFGDGTFSLDGRLLLPTMGELLEHFHSHFLPTSENSVLIVPYPGPV
ncbi:SH3 domain-binding protein 2-like isoform X2 [Anneissia japonica]|nr:SH3 domain-binding protein 2-like isoform X2 [Anneissia japonica]XP_033102905.1 SH3 domain-binding protein 2-like isoform X2 [Anneissia japonica]